MKRSVIISMLILAFAFAVSCTKEKSGPDYDPPADHTVSKDGYLHKSGLNDPLANCTTCHGQDLSGGNTGVSCFECHGTKW